MTNKPTNSLSSTQWQLMNECGYRETLQTFLDNDNEIEDAINMLIRDKPNVPALLNDVIYHITEAEHLEDAISKEIAALQARKARFTKRSNTLRDAIKTIFDRFEIERLECPRGTISKSTRKSSKISITDEGGLLMNFPELYIRSEPKLDKTALKKLLEEGEIIDGVQLTDTTTISIRK